MFILMAAFGSITAARNGPRPVSKNGPSRGRRIWCINQCRQNNGNRHAKVPNTSATAASSGSDLNGMAIKVACEKIKTRMAELLAAQYNKSPMTSHSPRTRFISGAVSYPLAMRPRPVMNNVSVCRRQDFTKHLILNGIVSVALGNLFTILPMVRRSVKL